MPQHHPSHQPSVNQQQQQQKNNQINPPNTPSHGSAPTSTEKGFYISFDDDVAPKRPKPPLRVKRASPKKVKHIYTLKL